MKKNYTNITLAALLLIGSSISTGLKAQCVAPGAPTAPDVSATCGSGATLNASGSSGTYEWYDMPSGGTLLSNNATYVSAPLTTAATYYVAATTSSAETMMPLPAQGTTFTGNVRGYYFTAPVNFTITGLKIPADNAGLQNIAVVRFTAGAPPLFATTTNSFNVLYITQNNPSTSILPVSIAVTAGDIIGILGSAGTTNSYAASPVGSTIAGMPITLARLGMQFPLNTTAPQDLWTEASGNISRVEMYYTTTCLSPVTTVNVSIDPIPVVATSPLANVCLGTGTTLTGAGATTFNWMPGNLSGTNVSVLPLTATTYTVTGTDPSGCSNTNTITIGINSLPVVSAGASMSPICEGDMETLTGSGAATLSWDNGVTDGVPFAATTTTTYVVTGTDGNGCVNSASTTVVVNTLPAVSASASATTLCAGDMETLTGGGANSYTWTNGVNDGVAFAASSTTTYTVTGTDGNGCMNTATTTVNVNPLPVVSGFALSPAICTGDDAILVGSGANTYTWDNGVMDGVPFTPAATATYMVTGTDGNGCVNTATTTVTVNSLPTITINAINPICIGDMETLSGAGAASYVWDNGVTDGVAFAATSTNTYMVTGIDGNGCVNTASTTVTVNLLPIVSANSSNSTLCEGDMETLTGGGAASYAWDNGVTDGVAFATTSTTTYMVTGTDVNGCMSTATVAVTVNPLPIVGANATASSLCTGGSVTLTGSGASVYSWDNSVMDGVAFTPANTNTYTVMGMDGNGCMNTASATVTVNSLPTVTYSETMTMACVNWAAYTLAAGSPANGVYSGMGVMGTSFDPSMAGAGTYYVTYTFTDANGCTSADSSAITVDACTGIQNLTNTSALTVYPNPNNGQFTITADAEGVYAIVNQLGQTIKSVQLTAANSYTMNLDGISNGIYFITGINGNKVVRQKVVVTK